MPTHGEMNRRQFFAVISGATLIAVAPVDVKALDEGGWQKYWTVICTDYLNPDIGPELREIFARTMVEKNHREIRIIKVNGECDIERHCWRYTATAWMK